MYCSILPHIRVVNMQSDFIVDYSYGSRPGIREHSRRRLVNYGRKTKDSRSSDA